VLVHDTDCVFVRPADSLRRAIDRHGVLTYDCALDPDEDINGLSRRDLGNVYREMGGPQMSAPPHFGAEIFAARAADLPRVVQQIDSLWHDNLKRYVEGKPHFNTEEHYLSYIYNSLGYPAGTANPFIRRIWTGFRYRTTRPSDFDLAVWHVPAEKTYGIRRLFDQARRRNTRFWTVPPGEEFAQYAAGFLGIPKSGPMKRSRDAFDAVKARLLAPYTS
jgi:hypothetical protein